MGIKRVSPVSVVAILVLMAVFFAPPRTSLSQKEADTVLASLGLQRLGTTPPILLFTRPGCGPCDLLRSDLHTRGVRFLEYDVTASEAASTALRELGKNAFGMTSGMPTPTTLVGTKIIRGSDTEGVLKALSGK